MALSIFGEIDRPNPDIPAHLNLLGLYRDNKSSHGKQTKGTNFFKVTALQGLLSIRDLWMKVQGYFNRLAFALRW